MTSLSSAAEAQDIRELLKPILDEDHPVRIPDDAVVIPYDPADIEGRQNATKVMVPYARYVELWNLAHPDQKIGEQPPEQPFSCAGASYAVTLEEAEHVVLQGTLDIEVFADKPVDVPLALQQGVITSAMLDGKPAATQGRAGRPGRTAAATAAAAVSKWPAPPPSLLTLLVEGKGRHRLELAIRVAVATPRWFAHRQRSHSLRGSDGRESDGAGSGHQRASPRGHDGAERDDDGESAGDRRDAE